MQTLQKALPQLVNYTLKSDSDFKAQFVSSFSQHLMSMHQSFPYFNKLGMAVRCYYVEENDSYQEPNLESVHFDIDVSAFSDTSFSYSTTWMNESMTLGNIGIFPHPYMLMLKKENKSFLLEEEFYQVVSSLHSMIYSVSKHILDALGDYCAMNSFNIVFDCKSGTIDYGEY